MRECRPYDAGVCIPHDQYLGAKGGFPAIDRRVFVIVHAKRTRQENAVKRTPPHRQTSDTGTTKNGATRHERNPSEGTCSVLFACKQFNEARVSHKLLSSILLACALLAFPALAQTGPAPKDTYKDAPKAAPKEALKDTPKEAAPAAGGADALTPDQAKRALDTLQDDGKRAQMIDTLRAIANAAPQPQAGPRQATSHPRSRSRRTAWARSCC